MNRAYTNRQTVNWYRDKSNPPLHNQKHPDTKKYWNEFTQQWCSKKSKRKIAQKGKVYYYEFQYYPLAAIQKDFAAKWTEQIATFLTKQFTKQLSGYEATDWGAVYWAYHEIEAYLGADWQQRVKILEQSGVIEVDITASRYNSNKNCVYIALNKGFKLQNFEELTKRWVKSGRYQSSIMRFYKGISRERIGILKSIESTLDKTQIALGDIDRLNERIWQNRLKRDRLSLESTYLAATDRRSIKKRLNNTEEYRLSYHTSLSVYAFYINEIANMSDTEVKRSFYAIQRSNFGGRISHYLSNAPKLYRERLLIEGKPVVEVDIKASQPSFLYVLFKKWYHSTHKHLSDPSLSYMSSFEVVRGSKVDIYQYMVLKMYGIKHLKDPIKREDAKKLFYRLVFGNPNNKIGKVSKREICTQLFGYDFYDFLLQLSKGRIDNEVDKSYKNLSALLQREESHFLDAVMSILEQKGLSFIPLYDSLIVKKSDEQIVRKAFEAVIASKGVEHIISIK